MGIHFLLFDGFETLDLFGPVEILNRLPGAEPHYLSVAGGDVISAQQTCIRTDRLGVPQGGILLVPGGRGTRPLVHDAGFLAALRAAGHAAGHVLSVCTGSALLAAAGLLDGRQATSNKRALDWVKSTSDHVRWLDRARWAVDGKFYTSSGVSAGMDMCLSFIRDTYGEAPARDIARAIEYVWNDNPAQDDFALPA